MSLAVVFAADFRAIGLTVAVLVLIAFLGLFIRNIVVSRAELGSEIELAPNRKPYLSDEELEGAKLDRSLTFALIMLAILAVLLVLRLPPVRRAVSDVRRRLAARLGSVLGSGLQDLSA